MAYPRSLAHRLVLGATSAALLSAAPGSAQEPTYRVRSDLAAPLNADTGWAGEPGQEVTVEADRPFRLRLEIAPAKGEARYALQARRNADEWETLEAHDFPHPQRELEIEFSAQPPGSNPPGWTVAAGSPADLTVVDDAAGRVLRARGGERDMMAIYRAPWPLAEFGYGARFRLPLGSETGFALIFGHVDARNYGLVRIDPQRGISVSRVVGGRETLAAQHAASIAPGTWHEVELELENGRLEVTLDEDAVRFVTPIEVAAPGEPGIAVPAGAVVELAALSIEGVARTPPVSIVSTPAYADGDATADLLAGSPAPFAPGFGLSLSERAPRWTGANRHGEFEWPLVIRRYADGPQVNEAGDRFEFRMVDAAGRPVANGATARVTLAVPPGHLGGTFVENPGRIGPWQATNGDLYVIMEPTETDNKFMMMKSADGGRSWREVDGANRPDTNDLESVDSRLEGDRIHIAHQVTRSVRYHVFRTSDHPTHPDSWEIRDEVVAHAQAIAQTATLAVRSDGSVVIIFLADRLHYAIRSPDGVWSAPIAIDAQASFINAGPQAIADRYGSVHLAYFSDDGRIWYRRLLPDGTLTARQQVAGGAGTGRAEYGAVLPLAYDRRSDTVTIAYRLDDGTLWERRVRGGAALAPPVRITERRVITDAVDSQQPAADLVSDEGTLHVLFVDEDTRSIFSIREENGLWQVPALRIANIQGSWVRGNVIGKPDGSRVYGYIYDAGSQGGAGMNRYGEYPLAEE